MNKLIVLILLILIIVDINKILKKRLDFSSWYRIFILVILDNFIVKGLLEPISLLILLYFLLLTVLISKNMDLPKID